MQSVRSKLPLIAVALAGLALFQFFGNANQGYIDTRSLFYWWTFQWSNPASEAQQGWLILALSGWLFWRNLREPVDGRQKPVDGKPPPSTVHRLPSTLIIVAAVFLHGIGFAVQQARLSILALLLFIYGLARLADEVDRSRSRARSAAFPLAFMVFAIPLNVLDTAGFWLRMGVIRASTAIAHACGIAVLRSGTLLLAPDGRYQYDVAAACSGVRSLMALAALSLLLGYIGLASNRLRAVVFLSCVPLVFIGNVTRIVAIIFAAQWGGPAWGDRVHDVMGWGIFAIVLGGVYALASWLRQYDQGGAARPCAAGSDAEAAQGRAAPPNVRSRLVPISIALVALVAVEMTALRWLAVQPPRGEAGVRLAADGINPVELPAFLAGGAWIGRPTAVTQAERDILPPDTGYSRRQYVMPDRPDKGVLLSIVLSGRDRTSIHRPEICLVGQGWTIRDSTRQDFANPATPGRGVTAALLHVEREVAGPAGKIVVPQLVAYWFVSSDATVSSHWARLLQDAWSRLVHLRADRWAYVLLQTDATDGESAAVARMQAVLDQTLPIFQR